MRFPIIRESVRAGGQERQAYVYTVTEAEYMENSGRRITGPTC